MKVQTPSALSGVA